MHSVSIQWVSVQHLRLLLSAWLSVLILLISSGAHGHELESNRVTLIQRATGHVTLDFYLDYFDVLQRVLAPHQTEQQFILGCAAQPKAEFTARLAQAQQTLQSGLRIMTATGKTATLQGWQWPTAAQVQAACQQQVMQTTIAAQTGGTSQTTEHHHYIAQVHVEAIAASGLDRLSLQVHSAMQPLLSVAYAPAQTLMDEQATMLTIEFGHSRITTQ